MTLGIKIAKFLLKIELFFPNQLGTKSKFGLQLMNDSMLRLSDKCLLTNPKFSVIQCMIINNTLS